MGWTRLGGGSTTPANSRRIYTSSAAATAGAYGRSPKDVVAPSISEKMQSYQNGLPNGDMPRPPPPAATASDCGRSTSRYRCILTCIFDHRNQARRFIPVDTYVHKSGGAPLALTYSVEVRNTDGLRVYL